MHRWWLLPLLLAACGSSGDRRPQVGERSERDEQLYREAVARGEVKLGMKRSEVREAWGRPGRTSNTSYRGRRVRAWHYAFSDVYFDRDGYVIGFRTIGG